MGCYTNRLFSSLIVIIPVYMLFYECSWRGVHWLCCDSVEPPVYCLHLLNDKAILNQLHGLLARSEPLANSAHSHLLEHATRLKDNLPDRDSILGNVWQVRVWNGQVTQLNLWTDASCTTDLYGEFKVNRKRAVGGEKKTVAHISASLAQIQERNALWGLRALEYMFCTCGGRYSMLWLSSGVSSVLVCEFMHVH